MADLSTIRIPVDSSPVNDAVAKIRSLELKFRNLVRQTEVGSAQYKRGLLEIKRAYQQLGVSSQKASAEIERYARSTLKATEEQKKAKREKELAAKAQRDLNSLLKTASNIMREEEQLLRRRTQEQKAANAELARQEAAYEQVKQAIDPLYAAQQRYNQQLEIINRKHAQTSSSAEALAADVAALQLSFARAGTPIGENNQVMQVMGTRANTLGMVLQQTGYQVGDFAVQIQSGTNAFVAFGQQATQLAGLLYLVPGAVGVIAGTVASIGIPVLTGLMGYFSRTGDAAEQAASSFEGVGDTLARLEGVRFTNLGEDLVVSAKEARREFESLLNLMERAEAKALRDAVRAPIEAMAGQLSGYEFRADVAARYGQDTPEVNILGLTNYDRVIQAIEIINQLQGDTREELQQQLNLIGLQLQGSGLLTTEAQELLATLAQELGVVESITKEAEANLENEEERNRVVQDRLEYLQRGLALMNEDRLSAEEMLQTYQDQVALQTLINQYGEDHVAVQRLREQQERKTVEAQVEALNITDQMKEAILDAYDASVSLSRVDISSGVAAAANSAATLARNMNISLAAASSLLAMGGGREDPVIFDPRDPRYDPVAAEMERIRANYNTVSPFDPSRLPAPETTGGGRTGGGGQVQEQEDLLQQLSERITKEQELLTLTDAQKQVVQALGDQYGNYSAEQISQVEAQIEAFNRLVEAQKQQQEILNTVDSAMTDAFMSMVTGAKTAEEAFADMARSIIAKLYEMLVVQQIVNAAMGFLQGPTAALTGAPTTGNFGGGRASGGTIMPGTPYLVGEQGPELIVPRHSGTVVNAANTNSAMNGGETVVVNNNINVTGSDAAMVRAEVTKMIPQITEASKAAVINARQRGGQMRATFGG